MATIEGRHIFYNDSAFDGDDPAINVADNDAIATDKAALQSGVTAAFTNYTSYDKGINGIMIDIADVAGTLTADDFEFRIGNTATPFGTGWTAAPAHSGFDVRAGGGDSGSDRVTFTWTANDINNQWLQVTVLANSNTGLAERDIHYWGNQIGETGNIVGDTTVDAADSQLILDNPSGFDPAGITNQYDINRDDQVDASDRVIALANYTGATSLLLFNPPLPPVGCTAAGDVYVNGATGDVYINGVTSGSVYINGITEGSIYVNGSTAGAIYTPGVTTQQVGC